MKTPPTYSTKKPVDEKAQQFQQEHGNLIVDLLGEANRVHLNGRGEFLPQPTIDGKTLRWTLAWEKNKVAYDLNIVVSVGNLNGQPQAESVFVHRHASAAYDFDGHMPTTRMRHLNGFSLMALKQAVQAEFAHDELEKPKS